MTKAEDFPHIAKMFDNKKEDIEAVREKAKEMFEKYNITTDIDYRLDYTEAAQRFINLCVDMIEEGKDPGAIAHGMAFCIRDLLYLVEDEKKENKIRQVMNIR